MHPVDAAGLAIGDEHPPAIMGVLNVSDESPYKNSVFTDSGVAAEYVDRELIDEGADIVDVGLATANKRYEVLSPEQELDRLDVAVETIASVSGDAVFSIETRYSDVAAAALDRGFDMVNDVCGFADSAMPTVCAERDAAVVKMASPPDLTRPGAVDDVDWAAERSPAWAERASYIDYVYESLKRGGFTEKTIVDPAFGGWSDAKSLEDDRETFDRLREFRGLGRPMLVSINRKNFLGDVVDRDTEERLPASLAATAMAVERGAHVIRTHDVAATRDAAHIGDAFARDRYRSSNGVSVTELDVTTPQEAKRHVDRLGVDGIDPLDATVRVIEVQGLTADARTWLARGPVAFAATESGDAGLLVGTNRAFRDLAGDGGDVGDAEDSLTALAEELAAIGDAWT